MNIEYLGTVGDPADTPMGIWPKGEVRELPDHLARLYIAGGNFAATDKPVTVKPDADATQPTGRAGVAQNFPAHNPDVPQATPPVKDQTTGPAQPTPNTIPK